MRYLSTRGGAAASSFDETVLAGLASDGGLYLPERWPLFAPQELRALTGLPYPALAEALLRPFLDGSSVSGQLSRLLAESYAGFRHPAVTPLRQLTGNLWLLELFHGPTLAFKDLALQLLGRLFEALLAERGEALTLLGATSGDTGAAAIEACRGRRGLRVVMLHPLGRISEVQRRQMTTVVEANVHNIAIEGTFDDCQNLVKAAFADADLRRRLRLSAVNSINWARILAQAVYYVAATLALGGGRRPVSFVVPTGNFGNVFAGHVARRLGAPVGKLQVASNRNDVLARFFASGTMAPGTVEPSLSPAMDIQISSNFERLLFELLGCDGTAVKNLLEELRVRGRFSLPAASLSELSRLFAGGRVEDEETLAEMRHWWEEAELLVDPHTAVALALARRQPSEHETPLIALATAHPAKFPEAVERATGRRPELPEALASLFQREERMTVLSNDLERLKAVLLAGACRDGEAA